MPEGSHPRSQSASIAEQIGNANEGVIVPKPTGFPTLSRTFVVRRLGSSRFVTSYDMQADRPPAGVTYYVAPGASAAASGASSGTPTTLATAVNKSDVGTIVLAGGEYWHDEALGLLTKSVNLVAAAPDNRPILTGCFNPASLTWTNTSGSVYQADVGGGGLAVHTVYDKRSDRLTAWNDAPLYTKKADLASITGPGQWAQVGTTLYVWALGNTNLSTSSSWLRVSRNNAFSGIVVNASGIKVYAESIDFEGCGWVSASIGGVSAFGGPTNYVLLLTDCRVKYAVAAGVYPVGAAWCALMDVEISSCVGDGVGYQSTGGVQCHFLEYNVTSHHHTDPSTNTINASTGHDDSFGIRVQSVGYNTRGPSFADVSGTKIWNLGCEAQNSDTTDISYDVGFQVLDADSIGWYDACYSSGFNLGLSVIAGTIYRRGMVYGENALDEYFDGGGTINDY